MNVARWTIAVMAAVFALPSGAQEAGAQEAGIRVPDGFRATVFADDLGRVRHIAVRPTGEVYAIRRDGGIVALRDRDGDGIADERAGFGEFGGTGIAIAGDLLYAASDRAVMRWRLAPGSLVPAGAPETVASGFPEQRSHAAKPIALDGRGGLYVTVGAPSNNCQERDRSRGTPGQSPCPELLRAAGIWRFDANRLGQTQGADGVRYATGLRNALALAWNPAVGALYAASHGRDQLNTLWPQLYSDADNAELPAEEFHLIREGADYGWPAVYYDPRNARHVVAPEYGGDAKRGPANPVPAPLVAFPAHWAPNGLVFYGGTMFPQRYRGGAFIAFHGSWNRAPLPQAGYLVAFVPFAGERPSGPHEVFADGFTGAARIGAPGEARHRPMGLAVAPDGALLVGDTVRGRIWRVTFSGRGAAAGGG